MKTCKHAFRPIFACILAFALGGTVLAQQAAKPAAEKPKEEGEVVELTPFTVSANQDVGYLARNTLAGTRLNTKLGDVASQVSVMTSEFLQDVAATTLEDAAQYSLNVELGADFAPLSGSGDAYIYSEDYRMRTRGLEQSTMTQDFFVTNFRGDSYNTERFTFASGPNAILFGLGSPAGLIDSGMKRAHLERQKYSVSFRADDQKSLRTVADLNVPIIKNKLGARLVLLKNNENQFPKGSGLDDRRVFATLTFRPFKRTEIRASYADVTTTNFIARPFLIRDSITPWLEAGRPLFDNSGITTKSSTSTVTNRINAAGMSKIFSRQPTATKGQFFINVGNTDPSVENIPLYWGNTVLTRGPEANRSSPDNIVGALADSTIFPVDVDYDGNASRQEITGYNARVIAEQNLYDRVFVQVGYNEETKQLKVLAPAGGVPLLMGDANMYLPDGVTPNPNAGRFYFYNNGRYRGSRQLWRRQDWRVSASTTYNFEEHANWTRWLGRHQVMGLLSHELGMRGAQGFDLKVLEPSAAAAAQGITAARPGINDSSGLAVRAYVDDPRDPHNHGIYSRQMSFDPFQNYTLPDGTVVTSFDSPVGGAGNSYTKDLLTSRLLSLQSYWWKDRIVTTIGWRKDRQRLVNITSPNNVYQPGIEAVLDDPDFPSYSQDSSGGTRNEGIVFKPFKWISFHYSKSATFAPGVTGLTAFNGVLPGSHGEGEDRGFTLTPFGDRIYLRVNFYKNTSGPRTSNTYQSKILNASIGGITAIERSVIDAGAPVAENGYDPDRTTAGLAYTLASIKSSEGLEIELVGNPLPNWRLSIGAAKIRSIETDIGTDWIDFAHARAPVWFQYKDAPLSGGVNTVGSAFTNFVNNINLMMSSDGTRADSARNWTVKGTTRYTFNESVLRGLFLGASYRWESPNVVGYGRITIPNAFPELGIGSTVVGSDINQPIYGNARTTFDAFLGRRWKLFKGRVDWLVQLNIRNVLNMDKYLVRQVLSDGTPINWNLPAPRRFILTSTFTF